MPDASEPIRRLGRADAEAVLGRAMTDSNYETVVLEAGEGARALERGEGARALEPDPETVGTLGQAAALKRQNLAAARDRGWDTTYWRRTLRETRFKLARARVQVLPRALRRPGCDRRPAGGRPRFRRVSRSSRGSPSDGSGSSEPPLAGADHHKRGGA